MKKIIERLRRVYAALDARTGGRLGILKSALDSFDRERGAQAAASIAYYALFSLFPLLLVLVATGSFFLEGDPVERVLDLLYRVIPVSRALIERNLHEVLEARGTVGLISLLTLMWSASGAFSVLVNNLNRAWPTAPPRTFVQNRSLGLALIVLLILLSLVGVLVPAAADLVPPYLVPAGWQALTEVTAWLASALLFAGLYRWLPNTRVDWQPAGWGALFAATALKLATTGFAWYVSSGLGRYTLVYGSLGAVVALLIMAYIVSWVVLFGAHLAAAIQHAQARPPT